jgi:dienelactone hydrolase
MIVAVALLVATGAAGAAVKTRVVEYEYDGTKLKGYLAYDDAATGKRPGVLVFHEWWGLDDYAKKRAEQLAEMGYVAFCPDMYGDGKVVDHPTEAGKLATTVRMNQKAWLGRAEAGLKALRSQEQVDGDKLAAIGYCFGGSTALTLAYAGSPLKAVVTFHAALPAPTAEEAKAIKARVLVCHGADDSFIPAEAITKFKEALDAAKVMYQFEAYPGAVHSFTVPDADKKQVKGLAYNEAADKKSWQQMKSLLAETLGK